MEVKLVGKIFERIMGGNLRTVVNFKWLLFQLSTKFRIEVQALHS